MAGKVTNSFSILTKTDKSVRAFADSTFLGTQGSVIDFAVSELVKAMRSGAHPTLIKPGMEQKIKDLGTAD
jgi:hypothetical protein